MKLYVDMDGVLADFAKAARVLFGLDSDTDVMEFKNAIGRSKFWSKISQNPNFWIDIEPIPKDIQQTWKSLQSRFKHIAILSAPSYSDPNCIPNKNAWLDKHIGPGLRLFEKEKFIYACPNSVLIDDLEKNIIPWREAGGIAIHFKGQFDDEFWTELKKAKQLIKSKRLN